MLVSSFLCVGYWFVFLCLTDLRRGFSFFLLVCLWDAMSITAFRFGTYRSGREIHKTKLGAIVITCAAADDITAWCLLAVVIAIVKAEILSARYMLFRSLQFMCW
jgi:Kef-type K+ transport system membrane component KefB